MLVVVGGHSRNIGKTSVACGIIRALPDWNWTAIKITQFEHGICARNGEPCPCEDPTHPVAISEEEGHAPESDSGRFLVAGARHAWWVRTPVGGLVDAIPHLRKLLDSSENVIVESNSLLAFLKPDFYAMVVDGSVADFKPTSLQFLDRANALVVTSNAPLAWPDVPQTLLCNKPKFAALAPSYESPVLIEQLQELRLANHTQVQSPRLIQL
jgi:hypothetical protein